MSMTAGVPTMPRGRAFTRTDLEAMSDDGNRYELIDGTLIVTPSPATRHQILVMELAVRLHSACPADLRVFVAPYDVVLEETTVLQPDLLLARRADLTDANLPAVPVLAVEVLSPSTRGVDLLLKKERLQRAGCLHYWTVDPADMSITAWHLDDGTYREVARAAGDGTFDVTAPVDLTLSPADLLA